MKDKGSSNLVRAVGDLPYWDGFAPGGKRRVAQEISASIEEAGDPIHGAWRVSSRPQPSVKCQGGWLSDILHSISVRSDLTYLV